MIRRLLKHRGPQAAPTRRGAGLKGRAACATVAMLLLAAGLTSCMKENEFGPASPADGRTAAFTVTVPGMKTPMTRALTPSQEQEVNEIDLVIFNTTERTLAEYHHVTAADITLATGGGWQFKVSGVETSSNITAVVIANASPEVSEALTKFADANNGTYFGVLKADFLEELSVANRGKWNTSGAGYWKIPMYGEAVIPGSIYSGTLPEVNLTRMLAKVEVVNNIAPAGIPALGNFRLKAVHVVNYNTRGRIAPTWNAQGAVQPGAATPNLPTDAAKRIWSDGNELTYIPSSSTAPVENDIYIFEAAAMADNTTVPNGVRLVLEGEYTSAAGTQPYYYPVDFTAPHNAQTGKADYIPVLRNHRYRFTITGASGRGYDRMEEAVVAMGVMSNLKTSILVVDESGIKDIVWDGEYYLGLEDKEITLAETANSTASVKCLTNYADGWEVDRSKGNGSVPDGIEYADPSNVGWLSAAPAAPANPGDPAPALELETLLPNPGVNDRSAKVHIKAGRLTHELTVTQTPTGGVILGSGRLVASDDASLSGMSWAQAMGISTVSPNYNSIYFGQANIDTPYAPTETTGCGAYYEGNVNDLKAGQGQWRLPTYTELQEMYNRQSEIGNMTANSYWGATENALNNAWAVRFADGGNSPSASAHNKTTSDYVRCVRDIESRLSTDYDGGETIQPDGGIYTITVTSNTEWEATVQSGSDKVTSGDPAAIGGSLLNPTSGLGGGVSTATFSGAGNSTLDLKTVDYFASGQSADGDLVIVFTDKANGSVLDQITVSVVSSRWARSNIVWIPDTSYPDGGYLTFAVTTDDNRNRIPANVQGVFFKWGSLVAITPVGAYNTTNSILFSSTGVKNYAWANIPYANDNQPKFTNSVLGEDDFEGYNNGTNTGGPGFNEINGRGDICRYISSKNWVRGKWRMPTADEFNTLIAEGYHDANIAWAVETPRDSPYGTAINGHYQVLAGSFLGTDAAANPGSASTPSANVVRIPAGGERAAGSGPALCGTAAYAYSGTSGGASSYFFNITNTAGHRPQVITYGRTNGWPIRCIRE